MKDSARLARMLRAMSTKVFIDGAIRDPADATVSVFDRGFLYGDSVYEVVRTAGGNPVDLGPHLERLARSGAALGMAIPDDAAIIAAIDATLAAAGNADSYVRVVVTRGSGEIGLDPALADGPRLIVIVKPLPELAPSLYRDGAHVVVVGGVERTARRALDPAVKSGNYLNNILALREAKARGAAEALICDARGRIAEGSTCNVFAVRGGVLHTPALEIGLLAGITRMRTLELARAEGLEVVEGELWPDELRGADEVFLTSSIRGVMPVGRLDDRVIPVGPVTRRLMARYAEHLAACSRATT
jgi:branched-chain amino acid aminotransferase